MPHPPSEIAEATPELFRPSKARGWIAATAAVAAFFIPQEVPLEYYPLNNPGTDINYLEITCASDKKGYVQIFEDLTRGMSELTSIRFPIGPSEQSFTYTFPLPDAPITALRLDPPSEGATLFVRQLRIINRRNEEVRRFTHDSLEPLNQIASINPAPDGWTIVSTPDANDPFARLALAAPLVPVGMNHRNLQRCLLSTGYLSMMLWIISLAVFFAFRRPEPWRTTGASMAFLALLAVLFSFVGNRGLIRNSIHYAQLVAPPTPSGLHLEFDLSTSGSSNTQLFWDTGTGISETNSARRNYEPHPGLQTVRFALPAQSIRGLRFDPRDGGGWVKIRGIRVVDASDLTRVVLPLDSLTAANDIDALEVKNDWLTVEIPATAADPILLFTPAAVEEINRLQSLGDQPLNEINK